MYSNYTCKFYFIILLYFIFKYILLLNTLIFQNWIFFKIKIINKRNE